MFLFSFFIFYCLTPHLCNTHVVIDDVGIIGSKYRKIHLYVNGCSSSEVDVPGGRSYKENAFPEAEGNLWCLIGHLPDRLSTGVAMADIELSFLDSVRARMPIVQIGSLWNFGNQYCFEINSDRPLPRSSSRQKNIHLEVTLWYTHLYCSIV
ncbi:hypothetical protein MLD38_024188 [Melastoma candidum]|uniref:Uncharacterized protein n=1 Tax=Melastoma candidum TaxID=119954 RepID=A0ACB9NWJ0_9MYRT|nr:hypothetical protein MLD38_024188 [Melastoma candidum]